MQRFRFVFLLVLSLWIADCRFAAAQKNESALSGTVSDPVGAVLRSASVELYAQGKLVASSLTDAQGHYRIALPGNGDYRLHVQANGFQTVDLPVHAGVSGKAEECNVRLRLNALSQDVVVVATATPTLAEQVGSAVSTLSETQIAAGDQVQESLHWVPGVQITQTGQSGGTTGLFLRGANKDATKVLLDGISVNDIGGAVEFADLTTSALVKAEVLRGPNSSVYGADAMAGVVSLTTRVGSTPLPELVYSGDGGNFSSYHHDAQLSGRWKQFDYLTGFARMDTGNSLPNDRFHSTSATANVGWAIRPNTDLRATVHHYMSVAGQPNAVQLYGIASNAKQTDEDSFFGAVLENQTTSFLHTQLRYSGVRLRSNYTEFSPTGIYSDDAGEYLGANMTIRGANGYSVSGQAIYQYTGTYPEVYPSATDRDVYSALTTWQLLSDLSLTLGAQYEDARGYSDYASESTRRRNSDYTVQLQGNVRGRLFYTLGTGIENSEIYGVVPTPRFSLAYLLRPSRESLVFGNTHLHASFGKGVKEPNIFQQSGSLYNTLASLSNGAAIISQYNIGQIGPEWSRTWDGGVDQDLFHGRAKLNLTYFHNEFTHAVEYIPVAGLISLGVPASVANATGYGAYVNSLSYRARGVESDARFRLSRNIVLNGGYTYLDAIVLQSFSSSAIGPSYNPLFPSVAIGAYSPLVGQRPFRRAPHSGYFGAEYTHGKLSAMLAGTVVGKRDDSDFIMYDSNWSTNMLLPNRNLDGSYQRVDLNLHYNINSHLQWTGRVQNMFSEHYSEAFGYPAQPLTFRSGLQVTFGGEFWKLR